MSEVKYPRLAELVEERLKEIRREGFKAVDIARQAEMNPTHLSMVRKGTRGLSASAAVRLAGVLKSDPAEVLAAAGHAPTPVEEGKRPVFSNLYTTAGFLGLLNQAGKGDELWFCSRGFPEHSDPGFLESTLSNLAKGVTTVYFVHRTNALDFVKLLERFDESGLQRSSRELAQAIVMPDYAYHYSDPRLLQGVFRTPAKLETRMFYTVKEQGEYLFRQSDAVDANSFQAYLKQIRDEAENTTSAAGLPSTIEKWLQERYRITVR